VAWLPTRFGAATCALNHLVAGLMSLLAVTALHVAIHFVTTGLTQFGSGTHTVGANGLDNG